MTTYSSVFGGDVVYPSNVSYRALALTSASDVNLQWPTEVSYQENIAAAIMEVTPNAGSLYLRMPPANEVSEGQTVLWVNKGAQTFSVQDNSGNEIVQVAAGQLWMIYITDNSDADGAWEAFRYGATTSSANAASLAGTGVVAIGSLLYQSKPITNLSVNYTTASADRAKNFNWVGTGAGDFDIPNATAVGNNWFVGLRNSGGGDVTVTPTSCNIDGLSEKTFQPGDSAFITCDGANFYTIGFGQAPQFVFDYTAIDVAGTGDYTLSGSELNRIAYNFTGTLTGNRTVIVPATTQQYWVDNNTDGAFTLTIKMTGMSTTGVTIAQAERAILYCNGTDVVDADTAGISLPVAINQGGTGATTAGEALTNLGGGAVGVALFESVDEADAWSVLGLPPEVNGGEF